MHVISNHFSHKILGEHMLGKNLFEYLSKNDNVYVAGGAVRDLVDNLFSYSADNISEIPLPRDIDIFAYDEESLLDISIFLKGKGYGLTYEDEKVIVLEKHVLFEHLYKIHLVKIYGKVEDILKSFDFTVCRFAFQSGTVMSLKITDVDDLYYRNLCYTGSDEPLSSLHRTMKYIRYGFFLTMSDMSKILMDINKKVDLNDVGDIVKHLSEQYGDVEINDTPEELRRFKNEIDK